MLSGTMSLSAVQLSQLLTLLSPEILVSESLEAVCARIVEQFPRCAQSGEAMGPLKGGAIIKNHSCHMCDRSPLSFSAALTPSKSVSHSFSSSHSPTFSAAGSTRDEHLIFSH